MLNRLFTLGVGFVLGIIFAKIVLPDRNPPPRSGFDYEIGEYEWPDVVVSGGEQRNALPERMDCGDRVVVYAIEGEFVADCAPFGQDAQNNYLCQQALDHALELAFRIECRTCERSIQEIWRGWQCRFSEPDQRFFASAAVEVQVKCYLTE
jgi:hypothetical protein